ncbi:MAG: hypothetical protein JXP36_13945 [Bacteroidales bacterium]|nr:hypothetical protein [Bacteroidales bacterium]
MDFGSPFNRCFSEFAFQPVFNKKPEVTVELLNQFFDNTLKDYNAVFHPKQIVFVTNLPEEYAERIKQTKAARHRFIYNKEATAKAMSGLLSKMTHELVEL